MRALISVSAHLCAAGSNFLTNTMLTGAYNKPFAVTYLNTSSFALVSAAGGAISHALTDRSTAVSYSLCLCPLAETPQRQR